MPCKLQTDRSPSSEGVTGPDLDRGPSMENILVLFGLYRTADCRLSRIFDQLYYKYTLSIGSDTKVSNKSEFSLTSNGPFSVDTDPFRTSRRVLEGLELKRPFPQSFGPPGTQRTLPRPDEAV